MANNTNVKEKLSTLTFEDQDAEMDVDLDLECHFKWKPHIGGSNIKMHEFEEKLLRDLDEKPSERIQTYSLLGYILTLDPDRYDPKKANNYFEEALKEARDSEDKRFVAEANLLMNQKESGNRRGFDEGKTKLLGKWRRWKREDPQKLAFTYGCHAIALSKFGHNKEDEAIEMYDVALKLDPDNWMWYFGKAKTLERKRDFLSREEKPSDETLQLFEKAMQLSQSNGHVTALYGNCLASLYRITYIIPRFKEEKSKRKDRGFHPKRGRVAKFSSSSQDPCDSYDSQKQQLEQKIMCLLQEAKDKGIKKKNMFVLKRCCKGYKAMEWFREFEECSEVVMTMATEDDSLFLHQVAQYYMKSDKKNFVKAKKILEQSIESSPSGNMHAALDLIKMKMKFLRKEEIDIDNEFGKMLAKYKPVTNSVATIHDHWARSLQKTPRISDEIEHLKIAIETFEPSVVQKRISWKRYESICKGVAEGDLLICDITKEQAYRALGWLYFIPEPKTEDNLKTAEKFLCKLETEFSLVQNDIECYGKILFELREYEEALQQFEKLENGHIKKEFYEAICFFHLGIQKSENQDFIEEAIELLLKSVQNGCLDACQQLLHLMAGKGRQLQYQYSGHVNICLENPRNFALEGTAEMLSQSVKIQMEDVLDISCDLKLQGQDELKVSYLEIRKLLLAMCTNYIKSSTTTPTTPKDNLFTKLLENAKDVLTKSRSILDHLHNHLQVKLCPGSSDKVYFPLITDKQRPETKLPGSEEAKEWALENMTKRFKNDFGDKDGSKGVADKCKDLIKFITLHQPYSDPERYDWLYDAWDIVNEIKHRKNITEIECSIPGKEQKVNLVELAQKLAFYAEEMLQEYCKLV